MNLRRLVVKHLAGQHDQQAHAGESSVPEAYGGAYFERTTMSERDETYQDKKGQTKTRHVFDFEYRDHHGNPVAPSLTAKLKGVLVPPGVTSVKINPDFENASLVATWLDAKGRQVHLYSKAHAREAAQEKFDRLAEFSEAVPGILQRLKSDVDNPDPKVRETARVMYLVSQTGFRIGSRRDTQADKQAYGASTLHGSHVTVDGGKVAFSFTGKKGVSISKTVEDPTLARIIGEQLEVNRRLAEAQGSKQPGRLELFPNASDATVRDYLKKSGDFKVKDWRTWHGTGTALAEIGKRKGPAKDEKTFAKWQREVADKVAKHLGNTAAVCISSYIDAHVWDVWRKPEWGPFVPVNQRED